MYYRCFAASPAEPNPAVLLEGLYAAGFSIVPHFKGDDIGWTTGELHFPAGSPILLARYLTKEDNLRPDLNAYAAELETMDYSPNNVPLMELVIQTQQLITMRKPFDHPDEIRLDALCEWLIRRLAEMTGGVYQADGKGWFAVDGTLLLQEY